MTSYASVPWVCGVLEITIVSMRCSTATSTEIQKGTGMSNIVSFKVANIGEQGDIIVGGTTEHPQIALKTLMSYIAKITSHVGRKLLE